MRIPDPPRIGQQELSRHQQIQLDRTLNDAMINSRNNSGTLNQLHVPISANLAILDDNLIDANVYYHVPTCLVDLIYDTLCRVTLYYYANQN